MAYPQRGAMQGAVSLSTGDVWPGVSAVRLPILCRSGRHCHHDAHAGRQATGKRAYRMQHIHVAD